MTTTEPVSGLRNRRFIGVDLGTTNSSVCYTRFNTGRQQFDDPVPVRFGNDNVTRSLLLLDASGDRVVTSGSAVYRHPDYLRYPERVHEEFKLRLGKDPDAKHYTRLLAGQLLSNLQRTLHAEELSPDEHLATVGVPAEWQRHHPERVARVVGAVTEIGFPNVKPVPEPIAAMYYHAFLGDIRFEARPQRWLVIDFGGGTTDLAVVETAEAGEQPTILHTFGKTFGGKSFDELLLQKHLLAHHWSGPSPNMRQRLGLLQFVREFKEDFSSRISRGRNRHRQSCHMASVENPVSLTREAFESDELAGPLIDRFTGVLRDGFLQSKQSLRDIDRVILTGGSARWYFVHDVTYSFFGREACAISNNPELTIAKGLALARTGFKPQAPPSSLMIREETAVEPGDEADAIELRSVDDALFDLDAETCRRRARAVYRRFAAGGGAFALLVSPIPGLSQPVLTGLETKLWVDIAEIYGYELEEKEVVKIVGGLLAGGTLLKVGVMEAMTFVPGAGWFIKGAVAGGAISGVGELAISFFERRRFGARLDGGDEQP